MESKIEDVRMWHNKINLWKEVLDILYSGL